MKRKYQFGIQALFWLMFLAIALLVSWRWMRTVPPDILLPNARACIIGFMLGAFGGVFFCNVCLKTTNLLYPLGMSIVLCAGSAIFMDNIWLYMLGLIVGLIMSIGIDLFSRLEF